MNIPNVNWTRTAYRVWFLIPESDREGIKRVIKQDSIVGGRRFPYFTGNLQEQFFRSFRVQTYPDHKEIFMMIGGGQAPYAEELQEGIRWSGPDKWIYSGGLKTQYFHPNTEKHKNFIERVVLDDIFKYYISHYDVEKITRQGFKGNVWGE